MEWVLRSPEIHNTFSNLGFLHADGYHVNENCNVSLETILHNILTEDKYLRTYRRSISFGQNVDKDLIPLLIHAKDDLTIDLLIRILVDLTIPIECLLSVEVISKTDFGRHTIFEINNLLTATKTAFTDQRATKVVIDFLKKNVDFEQKAKLSSEQCTKIINSLLLLRNILHIPEECSGQSASYNGSTHTIQNQILWNMFSHSLDKLLIKLMIIPDASKWAVTMVQLIALLYKDQHVVTLHKLLNMWLEASLSESSEDNESNTSPPDRGSEDSLPMLTSDPTSDSSDNGASGKSNDNPNSNNKGWNASSERKNNSENGNKPFQTPCAKDPNARENSICTENTNDYPDISENKKGTSCSSGVQSEVRSFQPLSSGSNEKKNIISETSDYGYGTQIENQESISTSSNDDELPAVKPVHQKSHNPKQRVNNKVRTSVTMQDRKRKKIVKRGKVNIINVQGLSHKTPTDDDIANILKEFTVDFLLKGYNSLVHTLHSQILTNMQLEIDTSHFFWLVTYFLKFATQIELDVEHVCSVLSYDVISYLTAEGVNLCEQFEIAVKLDGNDLKPNIRRLHLVVTAIREIIQAMEVYKKFSHVCKEDQETLLKLQIKICDTDELRSLFVLLLRHYNPKYHTKQYLQDLVLTNHILLTFLDGVVKLPQYNGTTSLPDHIKQFATTEIMYQYGLLLEDYVGNGEFVNDCVFTMMHHVGGELGSVIALFQPKILKTFTSIWKSEFEICEDWSDLIEYVINTFIKKPHSLQSAIDFRMDMECFEDNNRIRALPGIDVSQIKQDVVNMDSDKKSAHSNVCETAKEKWTETELSSLSWNYMQCSAHEDVIGEIIQLFKEDDTVKSRGSVIQQLLNQNIINKVEYEKLFKGENDRNVEIEQVNKEIRDDDISKVCEQFVQDGKTKFLDWVQKVLLDTCFAKICLEKRSKYTAAEGSLEAKIKWMDLGKSEDNSILSPISYHSLINNQSIPLVPWNCEQASICKDLKFLHLLHKLGFHMPVDSGKIFVRIPNFWTADFLYEIAGKILPIDKSKLRFSLNNSTSIANYIHEESVIFSLKQTKDVIMTDTTEKFYQIHKQKLLSTMKYTPMPGSTYIPHHQVLHKSEAGEVNKQNWLEVVKKSQEYKITLNLNSNAPKQREDEKSNVTMKAQERELVSVPLLMSNPQPSASISAPVNNFAVTSLVSTIMTVKQETLSSNVQVAEAECCNNNLFETASVASDLTRMYVSDEDEKPEVLVPPAVKVNPHVDEVTTVDSNNAVSNKRP